MLCMQARIWSDIICLSFDLMRITQYTASVCLPIYSHVPNGTHLHLYLHILLLVVQPDSYKTYTYTYYKQRACKYRLDSTRRGSLGGEASHLIKLCVGIAVVVELWNPKKEAYGAVFDCWYCWTYLYVDQEIGAPTTLACNKSARKTSKKDNEKLLYPPYLYPGTRARRHAWITELKYVEQ